MASPLSNSSSSNFFAEQEALGVEDSPLSKYSLHAVAGADAMGLLPTLTHGAVASVVDAGTTIWNSITPERMEASTGDLLSRIDSNALQVYNEHPDAVKLASFIGGTFLPVGLAMKGMTYLRSGEKTVNWFSEAGRISRLKEVETLYANGAESATKLKAAQRAYYLANAGNMVTDMIAAEVAINIAMSAHPFMEDYQKDLGKNFVIGVALGSGIGGVAGHIIARGQIAGVKKAIEKEFTTVLRESTKPVEEFRHAGEQFITRRQNIDNIEAHIAAAADPLNPLTLSPMAVERLKFLVGQEKGRLVDDFNRASSEDIRNLPADVQEFFMNTLADARFVGVDTIDVLKLVKDKKVEGVKAGILQSAWDFAQQIVNKKGVKKLTRVDGIYATPFGRFIGKEEGVNYSTIADTGETLISLEKGFDKTVGALARNDAAINASILPTALVEKDFAQALLLMQSKSTKELKAKPIVAAPDDIATIMALQNRLNELKSLGEDVSEVRLLITKNAPSFGALEQVMLKRHGINPNYLQEMRKLGEEENWKKYSLYHPSEGVLSEIAPLSTITEKAIRDWIHSFNSEARTLMRIGALYLRNEVGVTNEALAMATKGATVIQELQHHPKSVALRNELSNHADAEGYVYLYRGLKNDAKGHRGLESYTILPEKAAEFGKVKLYKVKVDDIIGTVHDIGYSKNPEIWVLNPTREATELKTLHELPEELIMSTKVDKETTPITKITGTTTLAENEIEGFLELSIREQIKQLQELNFGVETIALRTGVPLETVEKIILGEPIGGVGLSKFTSTIQIEQALDPINRALALSTSLDKIPSAEIQSYLNKSAYEVISQQLVEAHMFSSPSSFVRSIATQLLSDESKVQLQFLSKEVQDIISSGIGSTLTSSADSVMKRLGAVGQYAVAFGKHIIDAKNIAKESFTTPLSQSSTKIAKNNALLIELNTALNVQASVAGMKVFKAGQWWKQVAGKHSATAIIAMPDKEFKVWANSVGKNSKEPMMETVKFKEAEYSVATKEVQEMLIQFQNAGRELYEVANVSHKARGLGDLSDIGFWSPAANPRGKQIAYAFNSRTQETTMLMAKTVDELMEGIGKYKANLGLDAKFTTVVTKGLDQTAFNKLAGRHDPMYMGVADLSKQHGGASARAVVSTNTEILADMVQGYDYYISRGIDNIAQLQLAPIFDQLDNLSAVSQANFSAGSLNIIEKMRSTPIDPGQIVKNILLGRPNLDQHEWWATTQNGMQVVADTGLKAISDIFSPILGKGARTPEEWKKTVAEMEARGIINPFQTLELTESAAKTIGVTSNKNLQFGEEVFLAEGKVASTSLSPRAIALSNGLAATVMLRMGDLAQPIVNILSLPILTSGALSRERAASFAGATLNPMAKFSLVETMYSGARLMYHPTLGINGKFGEMAIKANLFKNDWRELNAIMKQVKSLEPGIMTNLEDALDSKLVNWLSTYADKSETFVRQQAFFTGIHIAKKAYPGLSDAGAMTFARGFMDEAIGNYAAAQRPALFQGTLGVAMGLFQTYMLTMGQHIYSQVETKNWKALGKMMLAQSSIFGTSSLPGFHPISEAIGEHFSDNNVDFTTGTFTAIDDPVASILLYGLPSQLAGLTTRGDIQPRIPNPLAGLDTIAAVNITGQAFSAMERVARAAFTTDENTGMAMLEALSLQSISRPIARISELISGHSITSTGKIIAQPEEVYTAQGIIGRVLATRPIQEIKAREAMHLDSMYGSIDREKRQKVTIKLKSYIHNGNLTTEKLDNLAYEYLRTGSPTGWRSAVREAIAQSGRPGSATVREHLHPNSPTMMMIDDLD